ncbi:Cobaltochelatase [Methanococcus aeolicus Nankai-3]|uniref:Cobaltochelatase n=1 Tax=Methanococcus aeolicus (strain ATCC BAA-1280 / DSM 17508 / OCM 812 / Nankai-3) TaxID=419665 RepID=A6UT79_META3|nr:cobaltochelatase subunit CobN [Methanococcus aeolicus]ABR55701.1 Cobaltochelatase [Methanococcus aeolicus Nankai-3]
MKNNKKSIIKYKKQDINITIIMWASYCSIINNSYNLLKKELKDKYGININLNLYSTRDISDRFDDFSNDAKNSDIVFMYRTSADDFYDDNIEFNFKNLIITGQDPSYWNSKLSSNAYIYTTYGGIENFKNLILYLISNSNLGVDIEYNEPNKLPFQGIYYKEKIYEDLNDYLKNNKNIVSNKNTVGILFSRHYLVNEDLEVIDELINRLNKYFNIIPVFTYGAKDEYIGALGSGQCILNYFFKEDKPIIDAMVNLLSFPLGTVKNKSTLKKITGVNILKKLNIPVFHPIMSYYKSYDEWKENIQGLSSEIGWNVALPEFEGVIEPIIIGTTEKNGSLEKKKPIEDRIDKVVNRIKKWIDLKNVQNKDKKVIFVLHNAACASVEATVGSAAHLDTFQSMINIMNKMKEEGYCIENIPKDGDELVKMILDKKAISEFRWTTVNEIISKGGALHLMDEMEYMDYFNTLPKKVKNKILDTWGDLNGKDIPASMVYKDENNKNKIVITGLKFGNIYLCVQPKRGCAGARCDGNVCKILHDPECPPTHQYMATYKYFNEIGDVIVHVGTHGSLEFLPGKNIALSNECYPDICINDTPHLYIYNSDNPPEGTIAKRRSSATLISHMQTVMIDAFYSELETLDNYVNEYLKEMDISKRHQLEHLIIEEVKKTNLLKIKEIIESIENDANKSLHNNFNEIYSDLRNTLEMIKTSKCNDGMHIFGELPQDDKRIEFINSILEFDHRNNKNLKENIGKILNNEDIEDKYIEDKELKDRIIDLNKRIEDSKEIESLLNGFDAKYIEPGPSGLITRGRDDILPTGRNFYSLDPYKVPTKSAYRIGVLLAEHIIDKYLTENNSYPENVAIYWMCSDIMWADGEGMAQILHLMGTKPKWKHGKVVGVEIIPLEELNRPRIDITMRVSGILRDNFPNCMDIVDEAISKVAKLDEPSEMNFVKKHVMEGLDNGLSFREATYRIFSSKPGTYGNGVKYAIYSSAWENEEDLKDAFMMWNSYAYGKGIFGDNAKKSFENILKSVDLTFNKTVSDEYDLFGCCGYFGTHGGLTNAAKVISKKEVKSYYGDTRNPDKVGIRTLNEEIERVSLTKLLNPNWIEGMKKHGYKGAGDISKRVGRVFGWSATTKEVDNWIFEEIYNTFVKNEENKEFFRENNPYAMEEIGRRLLEAYQRGLWKTDENNIDDLKMIYMEIEGDIEDTYGDIDIGEFQGGSIDIDMSWKKKLKEKY